MQLFEKGGGDVGGGGPRGCSECDGRGGGFGGEEDGGDVRVEGEGFTPTGEVSGQQERWFPSRVACGMDLPVDGFGVVVFGFQRRCDVGVDPEGPERIVEVEDDDLGQREAIIEGFWGRNVFGDDGWGGGRCVGLLAPDHDQ